MHAIVNRSYFVVVLINSDSIYLIRSSHHFVINTLKIYNFNRTSCGVTLLI